MALLQALPRGLECVAGTSSSAREGQLPGTRGAGRGLQRNTACGGATGAISHVVAELRAGPRGPSAATGTGSACTYLFTF